MLDQFMAGLSNEAQLKIALRVADLALPLWSEYFNAHPGKIREVNDLVTEDRRLAGAYPTIDVGLPEKALKELRAGLDAARTKSKRPAAVMQENPRLTPLLRTFMAPLTNPRWDEVLPRGVRLVFTSVWNILTWLLFCEKNQEGETHISVAVNQSADALLSEKRKSIDEINALLAEYAGETRPDDERDGGIPYRKADAPTTTDEVYQKIIGPVPPKDAPSQAQAAEIARQMRDEGKSYWDTWEEYYTGTNTDYSYDKDEKKFKKVEMDVIVGSFCNTYWLSEAEVIDAIRRYSLRDLRESGFTI
jgi:hypothetical protein